MVSQIIECLRLMNPKWNNETQFLMPTGMYNMKKWEEKWQNFMMMFLDSFFAIYRDKSEITQEEQI